MINNITEASDYISCFLSEILRYARDGDTKAKELVRIYSRYLALNKDPRLDESLIKRLNEYIESEEEEVVTK